MGQVIYMDIQTKHTQIIKHHLCSKSNFIIRVLLSTLKFDCSHFGIILDETEEKDFISLEFELSQET